MTPQLQHAIKLLQMSTLDLRQEIQENLESNPLLEVEENLVQEEESINPEENQKHENNLVDLGAETGLIRNSIEDKPGEENQITDKLEDPLSEELPLDTTWEDTYQSTQSNAKEKSENVNSQDYISNNSSEETLQDLSLIHI